MNDQELLFTAVVLVLSTVAFVLWLSRARSGWVKTLLDWFPAILFAYVIPAAFTHLADLDLSGVPLHDWSKSWIIPFTILTVMSALSFNQLRIVGVKPVIVFVSGSLVIATLPVLLVWLFGLLHPGNYELFLDQEYWKGLPPIVAGTPESLFLSVLVLDNILVNIWTILMFQFVKQSDRINRAWGITGALPAVDPPAINSNTSLVRINLVTIGVIAIVMACSYFLRMGFLTSIIALSIAGITLGNVIRLWNHRLVLQMAGFSIVLIMAILGLKLDFANLSLPLNLIFLVLIWLLLHFGSMLLTARLLRTNIAWVAIGSMANLGGISTAPAVTAAYKKELMPHAIVLAILSMVTGTGWGMLTIFLFGLF